MTKPKILLFDIETAPLLSHTWGMWEQNVIKVVKDWELLSFAYKFHGDKEIKCVARCDFKDKTEKSLVKALWEIINESDIIVAHNGDSFDIKKSNAKFIQYDLIPPTSYKKIDTKKIATRYFKFTSNSLNELAKLLKLGEKTPSGGFDLWLGCMSNDKKSWNLMKKYNKHDVFLLERLYLRLLPWIDNHPNLNTYNETIDSCTNCSSTKLTPCGILKKNNVLFKQYRCGKCNKISRNRVPEKTEKPNIVNI